MITTEKRTVYVSEVDGDKRGFLTLDAALKRTCRGLIRRTCECEGADWHTGYGGCTCGWHDRRDSDGTTLEERVSIRFVRFWRPFVRRTLRAGAPDG